MRILYLHGFASSPRSTKARFFAEHFATRGITLEIPDLDSGDFEHLTISAQLAVVQQACRGQAVTLLGSSMGGYLAALYAARHPQVEKLVLMAPAFCFARRWHETFGGEKIARWRETGHLSVFHYGEGRLRNLSYRLIEDAEQFEGFPDIHQPALIFHGSLDDTVPAHLSEEFASRHNNVVLKRFESGHELTDVLEPMWAATAAFLLS